MELRGKYLTILTMFFVIGFMLGTAHGSKGYAIKGFVGKSSVEAASNTTVELLEGKTGKVIDGVTTNFMGKYKFTGLQPGAYIIQVGKIRKKVYLKEKNIRMDIDLSAKEGTMDYAGHHIKKFVKEQKQGSQPIAGGKAGMDSNRTNNAELARQIAGTWWGYSGSTERKIGLCSNGSYIDYTESSYSGKSFDSGGSETMAWGSANQGGGSGHWVIQGGGQQGTIFVKYNNGSETKLHYKQCGEEGCLLFNGNKLCRSSGSCN